MAFLRDVYIRLNALLRRGSIEREMDEEMRFHIDMQATRNAERGMTSEEARRAALISFGGRERFKDDARDELRSRWLDDLGQDVRYGLRMLRKSPGFTATAALSLALGIGANTAVFSVVNAVLLRPLPYPSPERLVRVAVKQDAAERASSLSSADLRAVETTAKSFSAAGAYAPVAAGMALTTGSQPTQVAATQVTSGVFTTLGVPARLGRTMLAAEDRPEAEPVVVLGHRLWQERFGGAASVLGQRIMLDGVAYTIVGVMPPDFRLPGLPRDDLWPTLQLPQPTYRAPFWLTGVARLAPGVAATRAAAELAVVAGAVKSRYPASPPHWSYETADLRESVVADARPTVLILYGAVVLVLLLAAANVANLMLARAATRVPEFALRTVLGAGPQRLARQLMTESMLVAALGGVLGLSLAFVGVRALASALPGNVLRVNDVTVDRVVLLGTVGLTLFTGLLVGLIPVVQVAHRQLGTRLRESGRGASSGSARRGVRAGLVVAEFALALMVLIGAGLVVNSLLRLQRVDAGIRGEHVMVARLALPQARYAQPAQVEGFFDDVLRRVAAVPGVSAASVSMAVPPDRLVMRNPFTPEGKTFAPDESAPVAEELIISPDYFRSLGVAVLRGRAFTGQDRSDASPVAVINSALARRFFPGQNPVGRWLQTGDPNPAAPKLAIVGVVADVKYQGLETDAQPTIYVPYQQNRWWRSMYLIVRTAGDPTASVAAVRAAIANVAPQIPLQDVRSMDRVMFESVAAPRFRAGLLGGFGLIALILASTGIYGVLSYTVNARRRETGVRLALGARPRDVVRMIIRDGMRLTLLGAAVGLVAALALTRVLRSVLYEVSPVDPLTFGAMACFLAAVGLVACAVPAMRAAGTDPMEALRAAD